MRTWTPTDAAQVLDAVRQAAAERLPLEIVGRGTRRGFGRPVAAEVVLDLSALDRILDYQPEELVLTVQPGAPLFAVEALLAGNGQALAFEPPDFGPLWGGAARAGTLGGAAITGRGGPRRLTAGGPRDHCLGLKGVNGFGQAFAAGGKVVKNVTGFDLTKLVCGSFGTLCAVTELTFKVLPAAPDALTLVLAGLADDLAQRAMAHALGSPAAVTAAAHLPEPIARASAVPEIARLGASATLLRLEGVTPSVRARADHLAASFDLDAAVVELDRETGAAAWREIAGAAWFADAPDEGVWKLSVAPSLGPAVAAAIGGRCFYDWGGGGVWIALPPAPDAHAARVRQALAQVCGEGGHATLMRAPAEVRAAVPPFQPQPAALAALTARVKTQFDPQGLFNPGRMSPGV